MNGVCCYKTDEGCFIVQMYLGAIMIIYKERKTVFTYV